MVAVWLFLVLSGIGLLYLGSEYLLKWTSLSHSLAGLAVVFVMGLHIVRSRRK